MSKTQKKKSNDNNEEIKKQDAPDTEKSESLEDFLEDAGIDSGDDSDELFENEDEAVENGDSEAETSELDEFLDGAELEPESKNAAVLSAKKAAAPAGTREKSRRLRYGGTAVGLTVTVVVLVIFLNIFASVLYNRFPITFDLTKDNRYTMSEESEKILKGLNKEIEIIIFSTEEDFLAGTDIVKGQFTEALKQYRTMSGNKISHKYIDIVANPALAAQYPDNTSGQVLFTSTYKDESGKEVTRSETIAQDSLFSYEYDYNIGGYSITSSNVESVMATTLLKVSSDDTPLVVILTGFEENEYTVSGITSTLGSTNYRIEQHNISGASELPDEGTLAVIPAPSKDYSDEAIERLSKWLANGDKYNRHLLVFTEANAQCPKLYKYIEVEFDITVTDNMVEETDYSRMFSSYYEYLIFGDIEADEMLGDTTGKLAAMPQTLQLLTTRASDANSSKSGANLVTFPSSARIKSMSEGEDAKPKEASSYPIVGMAYSSNSGYIDGTDYYSTDIVVCGSSLFLLEDLLSQLSSAYNEPAILNVLNSMTDNESDVYIPSYTLSEDTLEFNEQQVIILGVIFIGVVPLGLIIAAIVVFAVRRRL